MISTATSVVTVYDMTVVKFGDLQQVSRLCYAFTKFGRALYVRNTSDCVSPC